MKIRTTRVIVCLLCLFIVSKVSQAQTGSITFRSINLKTRTLTIDGLFFETASGRATIPIINTIVTSKARTVTADVAGHKITISIQPQGSNFNLSLTAQPNTDITKWGIAIDSTPNEYYTGLLERVVDGPQAKSWASGIQEALNLRGQKVDMIVKPTTSIYAPYYLSSRGYAAFVKGYSPGYFEFAVSDPRRVKIEFEGPSLEIKIYTSKTPGELVRSHAVDAGPPFLPPRWMYLPWRWRDEHTERANYYDGTPVT